MTMTATTTRYAIQYHGTRDGKKFTSRDSRTYATREEAQAVLEDRERDFSSNPASEIVEVEEQTAQQIGERIGKAIARDVLAEDMPREWTGIEAHDADQIPDGVNRDEVEAAAEAAYLEAIR